MYTYKENRFENYQKDIISMMFSARKMLNFTLKIVPGTGARFWVVTSVGLQNKCLSLALLQVLL